jgi:hypothetical protein
MLVARAIIVSSTLGGTTITPTAIKAVSWYVTVSRH